MSSEFSTVRAPQTKTHGILWMTRDWLEWLWRLTSHMIARRPKNREVKSICSSRSNGSRKPMLRSGGQQAEKANVACVGFVLLEAHTGWVYAFMLSTNTNTSFIQKGSHTYTEKWYLRETWVSSQDDSWSSQLYSFSSLFVTTLGKCSSDADSQRSLRNAPKSQNRRGTDRGCGKEGSPRLRVLRKFPGPQKSPQPLLGTGAICPHTAN